MKKKMNKKAIIAAMLAASIMLGGCGKAQSKAEVKNTANSTESKAEVKPPEGDFFELPDEALDDFDYLSAALKNIFPDAAGRLVYGFKGEAVISTDDGEKSCYVFDYYTFKKNEYTKIAEVAKDAESDSIYLLDEISGGYTQAVVEEEEREIQWHETATPALMLDAPDTDELAAE